MAKDCIVTGLLALIAQPSGRHPDQRVEPVDGADDLRRDLQRPVASRNVCELVRKDGLDPGGRPHRLVIVSHPLPQEARTKEA